MNWQEQLLDFLVTLDQKESPHGLYGLRHAYSKTGHPLPSWEHVLWSPAATDFVRRCGFGPTVGQKINRGVLTFEATGPITIEVFNLASTKVRNFGSVYRLDKTSSQREFETDFDISKELTHLWKERQRPLYARRGIRSVLLIAHAVKVGDIHKFLGDVRSDDFLRRYELELCERSWPDHFHRGFESALFLWNEVKVAHATSPSPSTIS